VTGLCPPSNLGVFNSTVFNGYRAFAERYMLCKVGDQFLPACPTSLGEWVDDPLMEEYCEKLNDNLDLAPIASIDDVVNAYKGAKKKVYLAAADRYWKDGVRRMDAILKSFVKFEKCALDKAPRCINPRSTLYNLKLGTFLKFNEHRYFEAIAKVFDQDRVVIKGIDACESATCLESMWNSIPDVIGIGGDASKFDMHVSREALLFEHLCYLRPYARSYREARCVQIWAEMELRRGVDKLDESLPPLYQLAIILAMQLDNKGTAYFKDGKLKFRMRGTRASGDLNTSLGNCIIMSALTYCWKRKVDVSMKLANNGDDCMYMMRRCDEEKWRTGFNEFYERKGFRMVLEPTVDILEKVEFCQSRPVRTFEGLKMVRNPKTLVTKGSMCLLPVHSMKMLEKWMMAVGVAEGSLARGVPVVQSFARAMRRNGTRCTKRFINLAYYQSSRIYHSDLHINDMPITDEARVSFWEAWGILPEDQKLLESWYDEWTLEKEFGTPVSAEESVDRATVCHAPIMNLF